jgi:hypothetical protein
MHESIEKSAENGFSAKNRSKISKARRFIRLLGHFAFKRPAKLLKISLPVRCPAGDS